MKNGLINNKNNEYIVLKKELYKKYGLSKGLILQVLTDNGGTFIGSIGQLTDIIGVITSESVKVRMNELVNDGVVQKQRVNGDVKQIHSHNGTRRDVAQKKNAGKRAKDSAKTGGNQKGQITTKEKVYDRRREKNARQHRTCSNAVYFK